MTVSDIFETIKEIDSFINISKKDQLNDNHFDGLIDLITEYREELMKKKVV